MSTVIQTAATNLPPWSDSDPTENSCQGPRVRQRQGVLDAHFFSFNGPGAGDATTSIALGKLTVRAISNGETRGRRPPSARKQESEFPVPLNSEERGKHQETPHRTASVLPSLDHAINFLRGAVDSAGTA